MSRATKRRHKVSLVGLGAMGQRHARVLLALADRFEVIGGYDPRADTPTPDGVERLTSCAEAIERAEIVVVATPIETHAGVVSLALGAARHVLVEKPLCATAAEAHSVVASARGGARLFVGHTERFNPVIRALARLLRGESLLTLDMRRVGPTRPSACGALVNLGVHDLDLAAYLGGGDIALRSAMGGALTPGPFEDFAHVLFVTRDGAKGHLYVDRTGPNKERWLRLTTRSWAYEGDLLAHHLVRTNRSTMLRTDVPLALDEPLAGQAIALADALDGRAVREIASGADGARAVDVAEQAAVSCVGTDPTAWPSGVRHPR